MPAPHRRHDHDQFRHGKRQCSDGHGPPIGHRTEGRPVLGKMRSLEGKRIGDLILPLAGIRGEGTSNDYFPPSTSLAEFRIAARHLSTVRDYNRDYYTGSVCTTNRRVWEHDDAFKVLAQHTAQAIDMETATLFSGIRKSVVGRGVAARERRAHDHRRETDANVRQYGIFVDERRCWCRPLKEIQSGAVNQTPKVALKVGVLDAKEIGM